MFDGLIQIGPGMYASPGDGRVEARQYRDIVTNAHGRGFTAAYERELWWLAFMLRYPREKVLCDIDTARRNSGAPIFRRKGSK
jgi:hypothetical protein